MITSRCTKITNKHDDDVQDVSSFGKARADLLEDTDRTRPAEALSETPQTGSWIHFVVFTQSRTPSCAPR